MIGYFLSSLKNRFWYFIQLVRVMYKSRAYANFEVKVLCDSGNDIVILHEQVIREITNLAAKCATGFAASWNEENYNHYWMSSTFKNSLYEQVFAFNNAYDSIDPKVARQLNDMLIYTEKFLMQEKWLCAKYHEHKEEN